MKRRKKATRVRGHSAPGHSANPAESTHSDEAARPVAPNPIPRIPLQLPSMTPDQAYLLLDAIEWLHAAIWTAHEGALVNRIIPPAATPDTDDIGF